MRHAPGSTQRPAHHGERSPMTKKLWLSIAVLAIGTGLLIAAGFARNASSGNARADAAGQKKGGTLRINVPNTDFEFVDPGMSYDTLGWSMLYVTGQKLVNFPEKAGAAGSKPYPEAAAAFPRISKDGKTYTFTVRSGLRFSDGKPVTAAAFQRALERNLSPKMYQGSPLGVNVHIDELIAGGAAFLAGKTQ